METVFTSELSLSSNPNVTWKTMDLLRGSKAAISKSQKLIERSDRLIHSSVNKCHPRPQSLTQQRADKRVVRCRPSVPSILFTTSRLISPASPDRADHLYIGGE